MGKFRPTTLTAGEKPRDPIPELFSFSSDKFLKIKRFIREIETTRE